MSNPRRSRARAQQRAGASLWPYATDNGHDARQVASTSAQHAVLSAARAAITHRNPSGPAEVAAHQLVGALQDKYLEVVDADQMLGCDHLSIGAPVFWLPSIPKAMLCTSCVALAPVPWRCDGCRLAAPLALERWSLTRGPTTLLPFLCTRCADIMRAGRTPQEGASR